MMQSGGREACYWYFGQASGLASRCVTKKLLNIHVKSPGKLTWNLNFMIWRSPKHSPQYLKTPKGMFSQAN